VSSHTIELLDSFPLGVKGVSTLLLPFIRCALMQTIMDDGDLLFSLSFSMHSIFAFPTMDLPVCLRNFFYYTRWLFLEGFMSQD